MNRVFRVVPVLMTLAIGSAIRSQDLDFRALLRGEALPLQVAVANLPDDYRAVSIKTPAISSPLDMLGGLLGPLMQMGEGAKPDPEAQSGMRILRALDAVWTKGDTVQMYGQTFLVTYALILDGPESSPESEPEPFLRLRLVRVDSIQTVAPLPDFKKEDLLLALSARALTDRAATHRAEPAGAEIDLADLRQASSEAAARSVTISNAKQLALAMHLYATDWDDLMPYAQSSKTVRAVIYPYVKNESVFATRNPKGGELVFNLALGGVSLEALDRSSEIVLLYDSRDWPDGSRVAGFADGHVRALTAAEWKRAKSRMNGPFQRKVKKPLPATYGLDLPPNRRSG